MMIELSDTLVAEFAVHGVLGHLRVANPALLEGLGGRIALWIALVEATGHQTTVTTMQFRLLCPLQMKLQMQIEGIRQLRQRAVVEGHRPDGDKDERQRNARSHRKNWRNEKEPLDQRCPKGHPGCNLSCRVRWPQTVDPSRCGGHSTFVRISSENAFTEILRDKEREERIREWFLSKE